MVVLAIADLGMMGFQQEALVAPGYRCTRIMESEKGAVIRAFSFFVRMTK